MDARVSQKAWTEFAKLLNPDRDNILNFSFKPVSLTQATA